MKRPLGLIVRQRSFIVCINLLFLLPNRKGVSVYVFQHASFLGFVQGHMIIGSIQSGIGNSVYSIILTPSKIGFYSNLAIFYGMVSAEIGIIKNPFLAESLVLRFFCGYFCNVGPNSNNLVVILGYSGTIANGDNGNDCEK